ncbi:enoyl-CoA hydratase/carnithine racemase [Alkalibacillus filiformis]|uniref:Enoyl-CoA hydratase/carnithine racemase n=1 Tax=Alkalibacillus filiformis TaxID=200990 RepID=A0ABU0DUP3_9BACI|nr:enoyl-CoA hydratase [Alkalibacillus filiformis]MDQ0352178.1 enoyl-CoA hydratase/carnithine racemase [Alkalibacillus filiformis]
MSETVLLNYENDVATVTLNRPEQLNAMNEELLVDLKEKLGEVQRSEAKILVITGNGKAFSAGGDMKMMLQASGPDAFNDVMSKIKEIVLTLYQMPKVTISALNGATAGLGLSIALASDYVIAKSDAKVAMNFIGIGLIPDGGGHFFMEQRVGIVKAKQLIWEGKTLTAKEAEQLELIDLATDLELNEVVEGYVKQLKQAPILAMIQSKEILNGEQVSKLRSILEAETNGQLSMRQTEDHQEGVQAFLNKRKPQFKGQ